VLTGLSEKIERDGGWVRREEWEGGLSTWLQRRGAQSATETLPRRCMS
jgi:hypothetical protein